jgi:transcriptional regulator of acetoin/glycerol metabolism
MGDESTAVTLQAAKEVRKAWERFVTGDDTPLEHVRPAIRASWQRSRQAGVNPAIRRLPTVWTPEEVERQCQQHAPLLEASGEAIARLSQRFPIETFFAGIVDKDGTLLYVAAPPQGIDVQADVNGFPGASEQEHLVGTNGAAIALYLDRPYVMHWYEHYAELGHRWVGGVAPIHSTCGATLGAFGIGACQTEAYARTLELVTAVAAFIEKRLRQFEERAHFAVLQEFNRHLLKFPDSPLLALCPHGGILGLSPTMAKLVTLQPPERLIGRSLREVRDFHFDGLIPPRPCDGSEPYESRLVFPHKEKDCATTVIPVSKEGHTAGFVVVARSLSPPAPRKAPRLGWQTTHTFADLIGASPAFRSVVTLAQQAANYDWPVLLVGESGTGKELFAQAIHQASRRRLGSFVALNLSTIPKDLAASELFGYEEGAFSGALRGGKQGKIALAHGGTLFLDELEDMPVEMQSSLLRFLEEGTVVALGGDSPKRVDVRIMAAMNIDPPQAVEQGKLRLDLYHRLNVFPIFLPPLRERLEDLPLLIRHLLDREGFLHTNCSPEVVEAFHHYSWPGNVRELRNILVRAVACSSSRRITRDMLPLELLQSPPFTPCPQTFSHHVDEEQLRQALKQCEGNIAHAAKLLHIHRATFYRKLHQYGLTRDSMAEEGLRERRL